MIRLATVSPCYNEELVLESSVERLTALFEDLIAKNKISPDSVMVFVNDGSKDRTWSVIEQLHKKNKYVRGICLRTPKCHYGWHDDLSGLGRWYHHD